MIGQQEIVNAAQGNHDQNGGWRLQQGSKRWRKVNKVIDRQIEHGDLEKRLTKIEADERLSG